MHQGKADGRLCLSAAPAPGQAERGGRRGEEWNKGFLSHPSLPPPSLLLLPTPATSLPSAFFFLLLVGSFPNEFTPSRSKPLALAVLILTPILNSQLSPDDEGLITRSLSSQTWRVIPGASARRTHDSPVPKRSLSQLRGGRVQASVSPLWVSGSRDYLPFPDEEAEVPRGYQSQSPCSAWQLMTERGIAEQPGACGDGLCPAQSWRQVVLAQPMSAHPAVSPPSSVKPEGRIPITQ